MPNLKSDREQSKEIRDVSRQFTSVRVLLRKNAHILTYTQRVWNRQFLQGEALREQKAQGLLLALEELIVHLFINVNEARLVFNSRKRNRDTREKMAMGVLYDFFFFPMWSIATHFQYWIFGWIFSYPETASAEVIIRPLEVPLNLPLNTNPSPSLCFPLLAFPSPLVTLIACKINYQSCHILHC